MRCARPNGSLGRSSREYTELVFSRFFDRTLEIDRATEIAEVIEGLGHSGEDYRGYFEGEGGKDLEAGITEGHDDHIFGVPIFVFRGELFWGHDRIPLLEERLAEQSLKL